MQTANQRERLEQRAARQTMADQQRACNEALIAQERERLSTSPKAGYYQRTLQHIYRHFVPRGVSVLEVGCGRGDLLHALEPSEAMGIDLSPDAIAIARSQHPQYEFVVADAHEHEFSRTFDYVILSDLLIDLWDMQRVLQRVRSACRPDTRIVINSYSRLWRTPLTAARSLGLANPRFGTNWLDVHDIENLLALEGFETIRTTQEILAPVAVPGITHALNRYAARVPGLRALALANFVVARMTATPLPERKVTVVVPTRNEAGNIRRILEEMPQLGKGTEIVFVEGNSTDDTWETICEVVKEFPHLDIRTMQQPGRGKGDAVRMGFAESTGDILMILDADLTVPAEYLERFYTAIQTGRGEFINGVRLVYPMGDEAMRFWNLVANKFFAVSFSWVLGQPIKDTLCGTKVLTRDAYERIADNRDYFGDFDPFGDFDLILGAAKQNMKILDIPIRYQNRDYGDTNISRWSAGVLLLRMLILASRRLKFV